MSPRAGGAMMTPMRRARSRPAGRGRGRAAGRGRSGDEDVKHEPVIDPVPAGVTEVRRWDDTMEVDDALGGDFVDGCFLLRSDGHVLCAHGSDRRERFGHRRFDPGVSADSVAGSLDCAGYELWGPDELDTRWPRGAVAAALTLVAAPRRHGRGQAHRSSTSRSPRAGRGRPWLSRAVSSPASLGSPTSPHFDVVGRQVARSPIAEGCRSGLSERS